MLHFICITVFFRIYQIVAISTNKYKVLNGLRISNAYKTISLHYDGIPRCASSCLLDTDVCKSANYHRATKTCELNLKRPLEESVDILETSDWKIIYIPDDTWELLFRGTPGIGVKIYPSFLGTTYLTTPEPGCHLTHSLTCSTHYRNSIIDQWQSQNIIQVKFAMYKNSEMVVNLVFSNPTGGSNVAWFHNDFILNSSFTDLTGQSFNFFSVEGDPHVERRFYINQHYNFCPNDHGWMGVFDGPSNCAYQDGPAHPIFAYMANNVIGRWENRDFQLADVLAIFVRKNNTV